jgi:hypothetical protein
MMVALCMALKAEPFSYNFDLPAALALAHRFFAAADILALAAALILRLAFLTGFAEEDFPLTFAHRAFCAAMILALPAALIFRLFFGAAGATGFEAEPRNVPIRFCSDSILSFKSATRRSCFDVRLVIEFIYRKLRDFSGEMSTDRNSG